MAIWHNEGAWVTAGNSSTWPLAILNVLVSSATAVGTALLFSRLGGPTAGLLAGFLLALHPNAVFNAVLLLSDTVFSAFVLAIVVGGVASIRRGTKRGHFLWGVVIGLTALIKPVLKFCPHLGCIVSWNSREKTWDCPCHGSSFDRFGRVLVGPTNSDLEAVKE